MPQTHVIYADLLFAINFLLDYGLLWATSKFGHLPTTRWRLLAGATVGALYGVLMLYPPLGFFYKVSIKLLVSLLIVAITFPNLTLRKYLHAVCYFYLISFAMAGAVLGGTSLLIQQTSLHLTKITVKGTGLLFAIATAIALGRWGITYLKRNWHKNQFKVVAEIYLNNSSLALEVLIDTGNELRDPLSQKPVMIVEYEAIKRLLPDEFREKFEKYCTQDVTKILGEITNPAWVRRLRIIPFSSIGRHRGMLIGFKPDLLVISGQQKISTREIIICIYQHTLSGEGNYRAILNPEILHNAA